MNAKEKIKKLLEMSREGCEFKKAIIPKGWAVVNVEEFSTHLAALLEEE